METINLFNPILLLDNEKTSEADKDIINDLLRYRKCICLDEGIIRLADISAEDDISITGVDAARLYCHMNRIRAHVVSEIDIVEIVKNCDEMDALADIITIINEVNRCNEDVAIAEFSDTPEVGVRKANIRLQDYVEHLAFNCSCEKPFTDENGRVLSSLCCIDYKL